MQSQITARGCRSATDAAPDPAAGYAQRRPLYVGSEIYRRVAFDGNHPLNRVRHAAVRDLIDILGWLPQGDFRSHPPASVEQLARFHDRDYIMALQHADSTGRVAAGVRERYHIGTLENPLFAGLFDRAAMTVGGSIEAARLASQGQVVFHPSGGTHHGRPDRASGFCYFNDPVFAILTLLEEGLERVLYIDLDAHHGDGVQDAFIDEPRVMTVSIHERDRWPFSGGLDDRGHGGARNLPVPPAFNDSELDYLVQHALLPLCKSFEPRALVLCCGADCMAGDPLSGMMLSNVAVWDSIERLTGLGLPTVVLGGGGYNPWTVTRCWAGLWGRLCGHDGPDTLPEAAEVLLRTMECDLIDEDEVDQAWLTTMVDKRNIGAVRDSIKSAARVICQSQDAVSGSTEQEAQHDVD